MPRTARVIAGGLALVEGEFSLETVAADSDDTSATAMLPGGGFIVLDTAVTPALAEEGLARDIIRAVQQARKDAGLDVSDRIALEITGDATVEAAMIAHSKLIAAETLAESIFGVESDNPEFSVSVTKA